MPDAIDHTIKALQQDIADLKARISRIEELLTPDPDRHYAAPAPVDTAKLFAEAVAVVSQFKTASASFLQRKLKIGYALAYRLLDEMEEKGIVGKGEGAKPRTVLIGKTPNQPNSQKTEKQKTKGAPAQTPKDIGQRFVESLNRNLLNERDAGGQ